MDRLRLYWELARPFTLVAPALGMFTGSVIALGASPAIPLSPWIAAKIALGTLMAAVLNAASNTLNQVTDLEADRINKPDRPIPAGRVTPGEALRLSGWLYVAAFLLATPVIVGAAAKTLLDARRTSGLFAEPLIAIVGFVVAFLAGLAAVAFMVRFLRAHSLMWFVPYRLVVAAFAIALAVSGR